MPKDLMILVESRYDIYYNKFQIDKLVGLYNEFVDKISKDAPVVSSSIIILIIHICYLIVVIVLEIMIYLIPHEKVF
jgi:hypothetical protein